MTEEQKPSGDILNELKTLGEQLGSAVKALWESDESRNLRKEIVDGMTEVSNQIETALKSAQESEAAKEFSAQVKETVDKARESDIPVKLQQSLVGGLRDVNAQLSKMLDTWEVKRPAEPPKPPEPPETRTQA